MSKLTASAARSFASAYVTSNKSSVTMTRACVTLITEGLDSAAILALLTGEVTKTAPIEDPKLFKTLVSQRVFAATLALTVAPAESDKLDAAIKGALKVASGALPRKDSEAIADKFKASDDGDAFTVAINAAIKAKKPTPKGASIGAQGASNGNDGKLTVTPGLLIADPAPLSARPVLSEVLAALELVLTGIADSPEQGAYAAAIEATFNVIDKPRVIRASAPLVLAAV